MDSKNNGFSLVVCFTSVNDGVVVVAVGSSPGSLLFLAFYFNTG